MAVHELMPCVDMREHFAIDPLIGKRQQLLLATQLCRMVLKVYHCSVSLEINSRLTYV